jgi:hypothetical protein
MVFTALASMVLLTACPSQPSSRRVVSDEIESLGLSAAQERCMLDRLEGYSNGELSAIADDNDSLDFDGGDSVDDGTEELQAFRDDFAECLEVDEGGAASSEPSESTEPEGTTESTDPEPTEPESTTTTES